MNKNPVKKNRQRLSKLLELVLCIVVYFLVFYTMSIFFKSFHLDPNHPFIFSFLATMIIFILNQTIKPLLVTLTIPITGITLGLFYPFINLFILKLADWILGSHFNLSNFWIALVVSILISIINLMIDNLLIKPGVKRIIKNG